MNKGLYIRINGRGNAWPVPLGQEHPLYSTGDRPDYANASYSIIHSGGERSDIRWEVLVDAGHGVVPMLLSTNNRIPEAIVLTHSHLDHILAIDWIVQSHYRFRDRSPYPVYASGPCREGLMKTLPHLEELVDFRELPPACFVKLEETNGLRVAFFPVYHGPRAPGAGMLLFEYDCPPGKTRRVLFTGDLLSPLVCRADLPLLMNADWVFADANNRFPYPRTNHWSVAGPEHPQSDPGYIRKWCSEIKTEELIIPHTGKAGYPEYMNRWLGENPDQEGLMLNLFQWLKRTGAVNTGLVHYSGLEDLRYHRAEILGEDELREWTRTSARENNLEGNFFIPRTGEIIELQ